LTPVELLGLIVVFAIVRLALSFGRRPAAVPAGVDDGTAGAPATPSATTVVREYLDAFIVAGLVALFLITFVVRTFYIPSGSMEPTLQIHDVLLVNEFEYRFSKPHEGDIVVFEPPEETSNDYIKRTIGLPGDNIRVHEGVVYRNGVAMNEPYIADKPAYELEIKNYQVIVDGTPLQPIAANIPPRSMWTSPNTIPPGCYMMFGDNRNNSEDSHVWGFAQTGGTFSGGFNVKQKASFTGHAFLIFYPFNRLRILR
jgi:signal peptidase I